MAFIRVQRRSELQAAILECKQALFDAQADAMFDAMFDAIEQSTPEVEPGGAGLE